MDRTGSLEREIERKKRKVCFSRFFFRVSSATTHWIVLIVLKVLTPKCTCSMSSKCM